MNWFIILAVVFFASLLLSVWGAVLVFANHKSIVYAILCIISAFISGFLALACYVLSVLSGASSG
jgi:hypothetical protein